MRNYRDLPECRSNLYALLSSVYIQIPGKKTLFLDWEPALKLIRFPQKGAEKYLQEVEEGLRFIKYYVSRENISCEDALVNLSKDWTHLFRGVDVKGPLPPYESLYRTGRLQKKPAQEINHLFSKMGIQVPEDWHQPSDYIGVELDFMRLLCAKEREGWEEDRLDSVLKITKIEKSFLENHLSLWIPIFCKKMIKQTKEDFYKGIARLTQGLIEYDQTWISYLLRLIQDEGRGG
jgi:TorA maturation chaperone TorD